MANRSELNVLVPQIQRVLPSESLLDALGERILKPDYDEIDPFSEAEATKIVMGMEAYANGDRHDRNFLRLNVEVLDRVRNIAPQSPRLGFAQNNLEEILDALESHEIDLETVPLDDIRFQRLAGVLVELDQLLRQRGGGDDLRGELSGLSPEDLKEQVGIELVGVDTQAGRLNFQDPEKGAQDVREAVESFRKRKNLHRVITIPPDYYQMNETSGEVLVLPDGLFVPGTRVVKPELMDRPPAAVRVNGNTFTMLPLAERSLRLVEPQFRRLLERFQVVELVKSFAHGEGDAQQYLRILPLAMKAEGLDAGTLIKEYIPAMGKAKNFFAVSMAATSADDIRGVKEHILSPVEQAALLSVPRSTVLLDYGKDSNGNDRLCPLGIGPDQVVDAFWGDYGEWQTDESGEYLFIHPSRSNVALPLSQFGPEEKRMLRPAYVAEDDPLRVGRTIHAQAMYTMGPLMREELGGLPWWTLVQSGIRRRLGSMGVSWSDLQMIRGVLYDNGRPLAMNSKRIREKIAEAGGEVEAGVDMMLQHVLFVTHVDALVAGWGMAAHLQRERRGDLLLASDAVSELAINMGMRDAHTKKYELLPPETIRMVRNWHKEFEFWKRDNVDWLMIALKGKRGYRATFRNPLNPDNAPEIMPVVFRNETNPNGSPKTVIQKINELKKEQADLAGRNQNLSDDKIKLLNNLECGIDLVEAVCYGRNEWGFSTTFRDMGNALADLGRQVKLLRESGKLEEAQKMELRARRLKIKAFKTYALAYKSLAPNAYRRGQQQIGPLLQTIQEDREMRGWLENFNFGYTLDSVGDQSGVGDLEARMGLTGLSLCVRLRGARNLLVGEVDKPGKYLTKYPYVAAELGSEMLAAVPTLNNAINAMIQNLAFGKPDRLEQLSADQFSEALAKMLVDFLFIGSRSQSETAQLLKENIEAFVGKALTKTAHLSTLESEDLVVNTFREIHRVSQSMINTALVYKTNFHRKSVGDGKVDLATKRAGADYITFEGDDSLSVEVIRGAGFDTNYPDEVSGKKPYVSFGDEAIDRADVEVIEEAETINVKELVRKVANLEAYGHRGAEALTIVILSMYAKDRLLYSQQREDALLGSLNIDRSFYDRIGQITAERLQELDILEVDNPNGGDVDPLLPDSTGLAN